MKAAITAIIITAVLLMGAGCAKMPVNGDLDGQWRLVGLEVDGEERPVEMPIFYCIQLHLLQVVRNNETCATGNMIYDSSRLSATFPEKTFEEYRISLRMCGIYHNPVTFEVVHLDKDNLVLRDGGVTVTLSKF